LRLTVVTLALRYIIYLSPFTYDDDYHHHLSPRPLILGEKEKKSSSQEIWLCLFVKLSSFRYSGVKLGFRVFFVVVVAVAVYNCRLPFFGVIF
jgi:hypothetical protein